MPMHLPRRVSAVLVLVGALLPAALAVAAPASAATVFACVKRHSGATRIVAARSRCRHGEVKLSWSQTGPTGPRGATGSRGPKGLTGTKGATGANGTNGSNGAIVGYSAVNDLPQALTGTETTVVSKAVPAGSYIVSAKTVSSASAPTSVRAGVSCKLYYNPGALLTAPTVLLDSSAWTGGLVESAASKFESSSTVALFAALSTSGPSTVSLACASSFAATGLSVSAGSSVITAIQTSANS